MVERKGIVTFSGNPITLLGQELTVGAQAPDFKLQANDLSIKTLGDYKGKRLVLSVLPSLDTSVCDEQARRFVAMSESLGPDTAVLVVSCDLPFAQSRWVLEKKASGVTTLSDHLNLNFGLAYGVAIKEMRLLSRSVFIISKDRSITYIQMVREITNQVDFDDVEAAASRLIAQEGK